jgi:hypothetical protein
MKKCLEFKGGNVTATIAQIGSDFSGNWWALEATVHCRLCKRIPPREYYSDIRYNQTVVVGCKECRNFVFFKMDKFTIMDYIQLCFLDDRIDERTRDYYIDRVLEVHRRYEK